MTPRPPWLGRILLRLLPGPHRDFVAGDLEEEYRETVRPALGRWRADLWFLRQALGTAAAFVSPRRGLDRTRRSSPPVLREARYAARGLVRRPGFAVLAIGTLAVGIGATSSVFSLVDAVLLREVPGVVAPERLAAVRFARSGDRGEAPISLPNLLDLGAASPAVEDVAGYSRALLQVSMDGRPAQTAWSQVVTGAYFRILGVEAERGRLFSADEADAVEGPALVVISHAYWTRVFGQDPEAVGRTLRLNGIPFTVAGVAAAGFRGIERLDSLEMWVPASHHVALRHGRGIPGWELYGRSAAHFANTLIRLAPDASAAEAERQLRVAMTQLVAAYPDHNETYREAVPTVDPGIGLARRDQASLGPTLKILGGLVAVILLVTCANVANLLVLRGLRRRDETSLRRALGAARSHLVVQNLVEALLLALPAIALGLIVAVVVNRALGATGLFPAGVVKHALVDARVFGFAATLGLLTALTFGLLPALLHSGGERHAANRGGRRSSSRMAAALQGGLSVAQLSSSLALIGGVLLLTRSSHNLTSVDLGFVPEQVVVMEVDAGPQGYSPAEVDAFRAGLVERVRGVRGVEGVAASGFPPFGHLAMILDLRHPTDAEQELTPRADWVTDGFFEVLGIPPVAGRTFRSSEVAEVSEGATPVVLNERLATELFGSPERAVGATLDASVFGRPMPSRVVGVVGDVVDANLRRAPYPKVYVAMPGSPQSFTTLLVRTSRAADAVAADVRSELSVLDPNVPLAAVSRLTDRVAAATVRERTFARLATLLAAIAVLLTGVGLYAVVAYATNQRRREFGIRMAIGASGGGITRLVVRHALVFGGAGVVLGLGIALLGGRLIDGVLFGVAPNDPWSLGLAAVLLLTLTVGASAVPAFRATRVDPVIALRSD